MLHHISLGVSDLTRSGQFYDAIFKPLGYFRVWEDIRPGERHQAIGYGIEEGKDLFALKERHAENLAPGKGFHLAFAAPSQEAVAAWHRIGLECGGTDQGLPKVWEEFGSNYYAAYLADPGGWQIEAVFKLAKP